MCDITEKHAIIYIYFSVMKVVLHFSKGLFFFLICELSSSRPNVFLPVVKSRSAGALGGTRVVNFTNVN